MTVPQTFTVRPVAGTPRNSPRWVPVHSKRVTTLSSSAICSSTIQCMSGNPLRWLVRRIARHRHDVSNDLSNGFSTNTALFAVGRLKPIHKSLLPLARVAGAATERDVLAANDSGVVDDVLPSRHCVSWAATRNHLKHLDTAINALLVSGADFSLKRVGNVPSIHCV